MMIAANDPDKVGPIVINGAPMSYWSGSWSEGEGENPMRYSGGLLGGSWLSLFASDMGNGKFDGAYLVENFENLNPANTNWNKYYNVWKNVDTEKERFLEFEKWWGGYFLMNEEEIRWIVDNLFVGNKLARGEIKAAPGTYVNLKAIRSPIVIFSSKGDNITPPQQAINWIADVYSSTAEIKANGQVIVALVQEDVGHLGIFVSGKIAQKEHTEIIEALEYIEMLRPGLYVMELQETSGKGKDRYLSSFREVRLEDMRNLNRLERKDEKPFEVVAEVSLLNEKAYSLFGRPIVKSMVNEKTAELGRNLHSLRVQRWFFSDFNPVMWPVAAMASTVKGGRKPVEAGNPWHKLEAMGAEMITASWNFYRDMRDATSESLFFRIYGSMIALGASGDVKPAGPVEEKPDPREMPFAREALAQIEKGGYPEALARIGALLGQCAGPIPLHRLAMTDEFIKSDKVLSKISEDEARRLRSEAGVMVLLEPERTLSALPALLSGKEDRERTLQILEWGLSLEGITKEQRDMGNRIMELLKGGSLRTGKSKATGKRVKKDMKTQHIEVSGRSKNHDVQIDGKNEDHCRTRLHFVYAHRHARVGSVESGEAEGSAESVARNPGETLQGSALRKKSRRRRGRLRRVQQLRHEDPLCRGRERRRHGRRQQDEEGDLHEDGRGPGRPGNGGQEVPGGLCIRYAEGHE